MGGKIFRSGLLNNPIGFTLFGRPYEKSRSAPLRGVLDFGKTGHMQKSLEVAKKFHMGYTDREIGPPHPWAAR